MARLDSFLLPTWLLGPAVHTLTTDPWGPPVIQLRSGDRSSDTGQTISSHPVPGRVSCVSPEETSLGPPGPARLLGSVQAWATSKSFCQQRPRDCTTGAPRACVPQHCTLPRAAQGRGTSWTGHTPGMGQSPQGRGNPPGTGSPPILGTPPQGRGIPQDRKSSHGTGHPPPQGRGTPQGQGIPQGRGIPQDGASPQGRGVPS